jgi:hypothetical protein
MRILRRGYALDQEGFAGTFRGPPQKENFRPVFENQKYLAMTLFSLKKEKKKKECQVEMKVKDDNRTGGSWHGCDFATVTHLNSSAGVAKR